MMDEVNDWIDKDENLSALLFKIKSNAKIDDEAALEAYQPVAEVLRLHKTLNDIHGDSVDAEESLDFDLHSVFEELAIINYMVPEQNIFDRVLVALYIVYIKAHINIEQPALIYYGSKENIPKRFFIYFFGSDIDAHVCFDIGKEFSSWPDSGAVAMWQVGV